MRFFGEDFMRAMRGWNYPLEKQQGFWRGLGFCILFFLLSQLIPGLIAAIGKAYMQSQSLTLGISDATNDAGNYDFIALLIAPLFPAALFCAWLARRWWKFGLPNRAGTLPYPWPRLGIGGWVTVLVGFVIAMSLIFTIGAALSGINMQEQKGVVETSLTKLASIPWVFAAVIPSIVLGAPIAEELAFRGFLFAALIKTPVGPVGTVFITSALWALAHAGPAPWIIVCAIFVMGLVLGTMLLRFGSLWVTMAAHAFWNAITASQLFLIGQGS